MMNDGNNIWQRGKEQLRIRNDWHYLKNIWQRRRWIQILSDSNSKSALCFWVAITSENLSPECRKEDSSRTWTLETLMKSGEERRMGEEGGEGGADGGKSWYRWHSCASWLTDLQRRTCAASGPSAGPIRTMSGSRSLEMVTWSLKKVPHGEAGKACWEILQDLD